MTAPVFVVEHFEAGSGGRYVLHGPEGRHAVSVKRLNPGEDVVLTDGAGRWAECVVVATEGKDRLIVQMDSYSEEPPEEPRITVVQALPKGDRGEVAVETMTETGVDAIVPWAASRCITQWKGERGLKALAKWRATAREAASSRAGALPGGRGRGDDQAGCRTFGQCRLRGGAARGHGGRHRAVRDGRTPHLGRDRAGGRPRGRYFPEEIELFTGAGAKTCHLGVPCCVVSPPAGTVATALLMARTGRWLRPRARTGDALALRPSTAARRTSRSATTHAEVLGLKPQSGATEGPYEKFSPTVGSAGIALQDRAMMARIR